MSVRLIFQPETPIPLGYIPSINMEHPIKKSERLVPDLIYEDGKFFFDVDDISARQILERDGHCYKLWAPAEFNIVRRDKFGAEMVTLESVNPELRRIVTKKAAPIAPKKEAIPLEGAPAKILEALGD